MKAYITATNGQEIVTVEMTKEEASEYVAVMGEISANDLNRLFARQRRRNPELKPMPHIGYQFSALRLWFPLYYLMGDKP